jgi:hypothetical protein
MSACDVHRNNNGLSNNDCASTLIPLRVRVPRQARQEARPSAPPVAFPGPRPFKFFRLRSDLECTLPLPFSFIFTKIKVVKVVISVKR